ncbi:serine/threonine-protein kinase PknD [Mycobacterium sp. E3198]|uniref:serine/threonine-protein kinase PknD n=1 Tax=Mycobacterium sp. E3198 TaxID=1834143 RepID=UPI00210104BB|nr:serine/threonine-protein kinase PknD [Mycobacterium sp. E3198]
MEVLGRGGMGLVWRAYDTVIDRIVALKILSADISRDEVFQRRFRREAHAVARLNSPHIVPIHTHGEIDGRLFLDMRLIDGKDLQSVLDSGPLTPARAVHVIEQIAKALHTAHQVGLLHRDVKPSNILLDDEDYAYLIDFGLVLTADGRGLTTTGGMVGTFRYMAPERFKTEDADAPAVDARSDVYALACVLYECLTAEHAIGGYTLEQQIGNHVVAPPPRPSDFNPALPRGFDAVIAKGMAKRPSDRYDTAPELARAAREALSTPSSPPPVEPLAAPRNAATEDPANPANPVDGLSPTSAPAASSRVAPSRPWWVSRSLRISVAALLAVVAVVLALVAVSEHVGGPPETALPFSGLREPEGVTVDSGGTVYVADTLHNRVLALAAGSTEQTLLPFDGLSFPTGVTTDDTGAVYVNDAGNKRVVVLAAGSKKQFQLPFNDLGNPTGLTVDRAHTVYVTDTEKNRVVALPAHSSTESVLPFTGLNSPTGLVVADDGTIYVADGGNNRVLALARGSTVQSTLPFSGLSTPGGVTVGTRGAVYVTDSAHNRVLKLSPGSSEQVVLPFASLDYPWGLAVGVDGTVYVAGHNNKIVALPQR